MSRFTQKQTYTVEIAKSGLNLRGCIALKIMLLGVSVSMVLLAQNAAFPNAWTTILDDTLGAPCAGCSLYTYVAGTTTPQVTYTTANGSTQNTNPVVLDSAGQANIWMAAGVSYKFSLYSAANVLIRTVDHIPGGSAAGSTAVSANYVFAGPVSGSSAVPTFRALVAADFSAISGACTNQFLSAIGTCSTVTLASAQFANQGTTTTLLHGNASGNPAWAASTGADFGSSIAARSGLGNNTASAAAPSFGTTEDRLAYQVAEIPSSVYVTTDFTTAASTSLQTITGLSWTLPANTALKVPFVCNLTYNQATGNAAVVLGIQDVTVSPTNIAARGVIWTSATAPTAGVVVGLTTTTATAIVSASPTATATDYAAELSGYIEAPSNASASVVNILVSTATSGDAVTIRRGSFCRLN
jgi:hypothetical protein